MQFRDRRSLGGRNFLCVHYILRRREHVIIILWDNAQLVTWGFYGILLNIWNEPSVLEVNIIWCIAL